MAGRVRFAKFNIDETPRPRRASTFKAFRRCYFFEAGAK
jgi:hypothetical protein